jgi:hypothetical protein
MISDMVLLKKLPDSIMRSVEAYIGCLSGAMMRDEYVEAIRAAGFQQVKTIDETPFLIESMINDPTGKAIIESSGIRTENIKEVAGSILSIKVSGIKSERGNMSS